LSNIPGNFYTYFNRPPKSCGKLNFEEVKEADFREV
jgi:hypothetical protein